MVLLCQNLVVFIAVIILATIPSVTATAVKSQPTQIRIGTRPSPLAKVQAQAVADLLQKSGADASSRNDDKSSTRASAVQCTIEEIQTTGDYSSRTAGAKDLPLAVQAVDFTGALDDALLNHQIDAAVHSLKDIPPTSRWRQGLYISCHLAREIPQDVLVGRYSSIESLPPNAKVGTSAMRRQAQILALRPDLDLINVRGNVETRLGVLRDGSVDALILAQAGLDRLLRSSEGRDKVNDIPYHPIPSNDILSAACQGIVAVVCRADDSTTRQWMAKINDKDSSIAAAAERSFLDALDSFSPSHYGQDATISWKGRPPLAAFMDKIASKSDEIIGREQWTFQGLLARPDGSKVVRESQTTDIVSVEAAAKLGRHVAETILQKAGKDFYA